MNDFKIHLLTRLFLLLLALALLTLAGCFDEYPCTEIGCEGDLICNAETGACEDFVSSCVPGAGDCAQGLICDEASGECRAPGARCVDDSCPTHQVCNAQTGYCEARSNCELDPCTGAAEQCDPQSGQCVALECDAENACPTAFYCASGGVCRAGCRIDDEDGCVAGEFCRGSAEELIGQCRKECHGDLECPLGQICRDAGGGASCEPEARCARDEDCRDEGVCAQHICRAPPCVSDAECGENEACDRPTGVCIGGDCTEDIHAPNQRVEQAVELRPGNHAQLQICALRSDWFSLELRSSDFLRVRLEHSAAVDLDLFVYDLNGQLLAANQQTGPVTNLEMYATQTQTVNLEVKGLRTQAAPYSLRVQRNPDQTFCRDDSFEENDTPADATVLPTGANITVERPLNLCGGDVDWFVLPGLQAAQGLEIAQSEAGSEVLIDLFTPDGEYFPLRTRDSADPGLFYMARLGHAGDYYIRASSIYSNPRPYWLRTRVRPPMECEQAGAHALPANAEYLAPNVVSRRALCPLEDEWEVEWLALATPAAAGNLSARVVVVGDLPALDIALFRQEDDAQQLMRSARFDGERYNLTLPVEAGETYLIRIRTAAPLGRILEGVDYQVFYRFESVE